MVYISGNNCAGVVFLKEKGMGMVFIKLFLLLVSLVLLPDFVFAYDQFDKMVCDAMQDNNEKEKCLKNLTGDFQEFKAPEKKQKKTTSGKYTVNDITVYGEMEKYKYEVVKMLNRLASKHPKCKQHIARFTAGISDHLGTSDNPSFFVQCGKGDIPEVVRFTLSDIRSGYTPKPKKNISKSKAREICREQVYQKVTIPSSVDFSWLNFAYAAKPNGNSIASDTFRAKNAFGMEFKYRIYCIFEGESLLDSYVKEER